MDPSTRSACEPLLVAKHLRTEQRKRCAEVRFPVLFKFDFGFAPAASFA